jgi:hypothetical protein
MCAESGRQSLHSADTVCGAARQASTKRCKGINYIASCCSLLMYTAANVYLLVINSHRAMLLSDTLIMICVSRFNIYPVGVGTTYIAASCCTHGIAAIT